MADRTIVLAQNKRHAVRGVTVVNPQEFSAYQEDDDDLTYIVDMSSYLDGATISSVSRTANGVVVTNTSNTTTRLTQRLKGFGHVDIKVTSSSGEVEEFRLSILPRAGSAFFLTSTGSVPQNTAQLWDVVADVTAASIDSGISWIRTQGYYTVGDGGGALYKRVFSAPSHGAYITSNTASSYWELAGGDYNVLACGAKGDGATNDSVAIQAALDAAFSAGGGTVTVPSKTFICSGLTIKSNVRLLGTGPAATLKAPASLGASTTMLRNGTAGSYTDENVTIEGVTFDGNNAGSGSPQTRFTELVSFSRVTDLRLVDCTIQNVQYIGVAFGGCRRVFISHCELTGCGYQGTSVNGGSAFWFSNSPNTTDVTRDVAITDCFIHDNNWHAVQFSVTDGIIAGCSFRDNKESHIFSSRLLPHIEATDILIANNTFDGLTKKDISAHAIEAGSVKTIITGNTIRDCDHGGIALTDVQDSIVSDNVIVNSTLDTGSGWGAIDFICSATGTSAVRNVSIRGNRVYDDQAVPTTRHAVRFQGSGDAAVNCSIINNDFSGTTFSTGVYDLGSKGATTVRKGNLGTTDNYPVPAVGEFQTPAATGSYSVTGLTFRPVRIELLATMATGSTAANQSNSVVSAAGTAVCHGFSATSAPAMNSTTHGNVAIRLTDTAGATITNATFTSYNSDGFTLNFTTVTSRPWIRYVAYPE